MKIEALGSNHEDTKIPRYLGYKIYRLNSSAFSQVGVRHFGNVFGEF